MAEGKLTGKVKWFNSTKGFGFITPDEGGDDLFVHQSSIHSEGFRSLADGEEVEYSVDWNEGRPKAVDVTGPNGNPVRGGGVGGVGYRGGTSGKVKLTGKVKWFNCTQGFGFITPDKGGDDLFVHHSSILSEGFSSLANGEEVEYSVDWNKGRPKAVDVTGPNGDSVRGSNSERAAHFARLFANLVSAMERGQN